MSALFKTSPRQPEVVPAFSYKREYFNRAASDFFVLALRQYCKGFTAQMRIQYDSSVSLVDTRPPTAAQTAFQPRAQESLEMLCIIHVHTRSICPNTHFLVSMWKNCPAMRCLAGGLI